MRFAFIDAWRHQWRVATLCRVMRVSERGYRCWRSRPISQRARTDMAVLAHIREQYSLSLGSYGRPRMTMELKEAGLDVGERRVGRLMRVNGIKPVRTRRHKVTTDSNHSLGVAANWLDGDFVADAPNRKWAGDITYVWTSEGWLYLAVILDLHSRRVVGWAASDRMTRRAAKPTRIWRSARWIWRCASVIRRRAACFILIAAANIVPTIIKRNCRPMACVHR